MTELSPAAQAVLRASEQAAGGAFVEDDLRGLAAGLRAAAECSCEEQDTPPETPYEQGYLDALERVFKQMNVIATELEGQ